MAGETQMHPWVRRLDSVAEQYDTHMNRCRRVPLAREKGPESMMHLCLACYPGCGLVAMRYALAMRHSPSPCST
jgi:hypothetical protein